jgi:hypothetical protein
LIGDDYRDHVFLIGADTAVAAYRANINGTHVGVIEVLSKKRTMGTPEILLKALSYWNTRRIKVCGTIAVFLSTPVMKGKPEGRLKGKNYKAMSIIINKYPVTIFHPLASFPFVLLFLGIYKRDA